MKLFGASPTSQGGELFLAVLPDVETSMRIYRMAEILKTAHAFRGRLTTPERLHVTLLSLSGLPRQMVEKACEVIGEVEAEPFEISFDRTMSFRGLPASRPFVLAGGEGLRRLKLFRVACRGFRAKRPEAVGTSRFHAACHAAV
jgi:2'-5' RNA ligase